MGWPVQPTGLGLRHAKLGNLSPAAFQIHYYNKSSLKMVSTIANRPHNRWLNLVFPLRSLRALRENACIGSKAFTAHLAVYGKDKRPLAVYRARGLLSKLITVEQQLSGSLFQRLIHLQQRLRHLRRASRHGDAARFQHGHFLGRGALAAGDDGAGMAHALARGRGAARR